MLLLVCPLFLFVAFRHYTRRSSGPVGVSTSPQYRAVWCALLLGLLRVPGCSLRQCPFAFLLPLFDLLLSCSAVTQDVFGWSGALCPSIHVTRLPTSLSSLCVAFWARGVTICPVSLFALSNWPPYTTIGWRSFLLSWSSLIELPDLRRFSYPLTTNQR